MATMRDSNPSHTVPAALRPWVSQLWAARTDADASRTREHVLPSGQMHLVVRVAGPPLRVFDARDPSRSDTLAGPVVGGVRERFYAKEHGAAVVSVGAVLRPGASLALFGVSAAELAGRHTPLADLWGPDAAALHDQLAAGHDATARLACLCRFLQRRVSHAATLPAALRDALDALSQPEPALAPRIDALVRAGSISHRGFIARFRHATGLGPKRYARLMRLRGLLQAMARTPGASLADLALQCGYSDQAHMAREFRDMTGLTPSGYRDIAPRQPHHVPLAPAAPPA